MNVKLINPIRLLSVALVCYCAFTATIKASDIEQPQENQSSRNELETNINLDSKPSHAIPANHRTDNEEISKSNKPASRQSRQYDGSLGTSSTGSLASISGDGAAYVAQMPLGGANYGPSSGSIAASYGSGDVSSPYHSNAYHDPLSIARGYPSQSFSPMHHPQAAYPSSISPLSSMFGSGPLSSSMFPLMTKGFDVSEIVCTAIAVAIGAVIVGAPFILIYLFVMNQMNGNGPSMGPSGGAISLTGPTSSTTVSGRKKRHTSIPEALMKQLSPLVNSEQVANTFKMLMNSIAKYQV